jgi:hypothetical protein
MILLIFMFYATGHRAPTTDSLLRTHIIEERIMNEFSSPNGFLVDSFKDEQMDVLFGKEKREKLFAIRASLTKLDGSILKEAYYNKERFENYRGATGSGDGFYHTENLQRTVSVKDDTQPLILKIEYVYKER